MNERGLGQPLYTYRLKLTGTGKLPDCSEMNQMTLSSKLSEVEHPTSRSRRLPKIVCKTLFFYPKCQSGERTLQAGVYQGVHVKVNPNNH